MLETPHSRDLKLHTGTPASGLTHQSQTDQALRELEWRFARDGTESLDLDFTKDLLISWAQALVGAASLKAVADDFSARHGKVFHDDDFFDARMTYFIDHALFECPLLSGGLQGSLSPFEDFLNNARATAAMTGLQDREHILRRLVDELVRLAGFRHSVFRLERLRRGQAIVKDLIQPLSFQITAGPAESFLGLGKWNLLQGFVFPVRSGYRLSKGLIVHPEAATRAITTFLRSVAGHEERKVALGRLATTQIRYLRHRHVDAQKIYESEISAQR